MTEDGHISNCLMNKTIRRLRSYKKCLLMLGGGVIPSPALNGTFYMTGDGHISNCLGNKTIRYMAVFGHIKSAFLSWEGNSKVVYDRRRVNEPYEHTSDIPATKQK